jgi:hypothetical protein
MTQDEATDYFSELGYDVTFTKEPKEVSIVDWNRRWVNDYDEHNNLISSTVESEPVVSTGTVEVPVIETITPNGKHNGGNISSVDSASAGNKYTPKTGGGGGSKAKTQKISKKSDVVERYKETNDALESIAKASSRVNKEVDRLYGKSRINAIEKANELLKKETELLKDKLQEAKSYLSIDKQTLQNTANKAGVSFTFNDDGSISNYTEQLSKLYDELAAAEAKVN